MLADNSVGSPFACEAARADGDRGGGVPVGHPGHCHCAPNLADVLHTNLRNPGTDQASAVAASVDNMYTVRASEALRPGDIETFHDSVADDATWNPLADLPVADPGTDARRIRSIVERGESKEVGDVNVIWPSAHW